MGKGELVGFHVLRFNCHVDNLIGYGHMTLSQSQHVNSLDRKTVVTKLFTHASAYSTCLINGFINCYSRRSGFNAFHMHMEKPTESHQMLLSPCVNLIVICAGVGWVWLAGLYAHVLLSYQPDIYN